MNYWLIKTQTEDEKIVNIAEEILNNYDKTLTTNIKEYIIEIEKAKLEIDWGNEEAASKLRFIYILLAAALLHTVKCHDEIYETKTE